MCYCGFITMMFVVILLPISTSKPFIIKPSKKPESEQSDIIFPDDMHNRPDFYVPKINQSPCSDQMTFCDHADGYPYTFVETTLRKKAKRYEYVFEIYDDGDDILSNRMDDDEFVCASKSQLKFPRVAMNTKNEWKYIVNNGKHKQQGIRVEYCQREGSSCKISSRGFYKTVCKQKYAYRKMLTISYNGTLELDTFLLPNSCCCSLKPVITWNAS